MTTAAAEEYKLVLSVGDTTFLDYRSIKVKRKGYGPTGNGGNGLILHSALAMEPEQGQTLGLLWQKLWNRQHKPKPPKDETTQQKKQRQAQNRKTARQRPFAEKESYKWVEALCAVEKQVEANTRVIHIFDREGDIAEVFDQVRQLKHTGVVVRASHNRSLDSNSERLWTKMESLDISFEQEIDVPATINRKARKTKLAVRFNEVNLRTPYRFDNRAPLKVYAVYATEIGCPEGETPLSWMLLTTEMVEDAFMAATILRWYRGLSSNCTENHAKAVSIAIYSFQSAKILNQYKKTYQ